jgi:anti-sigma factor RsiW
MNCTAVRTRIVAWQDRELSPGEHVLVAEHLGSCAACRNQERRLAAVTPEPFLHVPPRIEADFYDRLDRAVEAAWAHPAPPQPPSMVARMRQTIPIPFTSAILYAVALLAALGWGGWNWWTARGLEQALAARPAIEPPVTTIPAEQFRPASWSPAEAARPEPADPRP